MSEENPVPALEEADQRAASFTIPDDVRVMLKKPIVLKASGGVTLTELSFRPPTVGEMKQISRRQREAGDEAASILLLVLLSNDKLTAPDVEGMNLIDAQICQEALGPFLRLKERSAAKPD